MRLVAQSTASLRKDLGTHPCLFAVKRPRVWQRARRPFQAVANANFPAGRPAIPVEDFFSSPGGQSYDLWTQNSQLTGRVLRELDAMQQQMDRDLEGALARAERLAQRAQQRAEEAGRLAQQQAGGDGWQTYSRENSYEHRSGGGFTRGYYSERVTVMVPHSAPLAPPPPAHFDLVSSIGLMAAAFVAGSWAVATAAFSSGYHLTPYREGKRWLMLLLWPLLLVTSAEFRGQFWAAVRGRRLGTGAREEASNGGLGSGAAEGAMQVVEQEVFGLTFKLAQDPNSHNLGTTVWDASIVLAKWLEKNSRRGDFSRQRCRGRRCLELGSGMGLGGLAFALLGAHVTLTDLGPVLPLLARNYQQNLAPAVLRVGDASWASGAVGRVDVQELDWSRPEQYASFRPPYDYILAADCVYSELAVPSFLAVALHMSDARTHVVVVNEFRSQAVHEAFMAAFQQHFTLKKVPASKMDPQFQHPLIHIYLCKRRKQPAAADRPDAATRELAALNMAGQEQPHGDLGNELQEALPHQAAGKAADSSNAGEAMQAAALVHTARTAARARPASAASRPLVPKAAAVAGIATGSGAVSGPAAGQKGAAAAQASLVQDQLVALVANSGDGASGAPFSDGCVAMAGSLDASEPCHPHQPHERQQK
ncbi:hypothetical protein N2152v2_000626 [Parachlorella kessleri]